MSEKENKEKLKKQEPWNSFAYLVSLAKEKEPVTIHVNTNTIEDEAQLKGIIIEVDNYTVAFLTNNGRELLVFKHAVRFIERIKEK